MFSIINEWTLLLRIVQRKIARCQQEQPPVFCVLTSEGCNTALTSKYFVLFCSFTDGFMDCFCVL